MGRGELFSAVWFYKLLVSLSFDVGKHCGLISLTFAAGMNKVVEKSYSVGCEL